MRLASTILIVMSCITYGRPQAMIENIVPSGDADLNYEDLFENLAQLTTNPIDINCATSDQLSSLGILTQSQVDNIIVYRKDNGDLLEIYELQSIPSLDLETIHEILPYVTIRSSAPGKNFLGRVRSQHNTYLFARYERTLQRADGYSMSGDSVTLYRGDPGRFYSRFRTTSPGDLSIGLTAEKDAGEQLQWNKTQRGFDFHSGHVQLLNKGPTTNFIAGDYTAQFGQGLTLGGGFGMGKGSETITTLRRSSTGFLPYSSANEAGFFRGIASSFSLPASFVLHTFGSSLQRDASNSDEGSLSVLQSGKHRTENELNGRHRLTERNYGVVVEYKALPRQHRGSLDIGWILHHTSFSQPINKSPTIYNTFDFGGTSNTNTGLFANYNFQNLNFFGEFSQTIGRGRGCVGGVLASISRNIDASLLVRHYDRTFYTFYSNAISESTTPKNESGIYWGWKHAINRRLFYTAYVDLFTFPWLRFRNYQPSTGTEELIRLTYKQSKTSEFFVQFRDERKSRNIPGEAPAYKSATANRQNWILGSSLSFGKLSLKGRIQFSSLRQQTTTRGFAIAFDAGYDWNRFSVATRFAVFDTDDFDNRQYMNERDVLMAFSFPAYYGEGTRSYLVGRFQATSWLDLWIKIAETSYFTATSSGSGGDMIDGSKRHDFKAEAVFRLN